MKFVNREKELALLESEYAQERFSFTVLYGRRRVGKTRLIREFIQGKNAIYFLADTQTEKLNLEAFCSNASEMLDDPLLNQVVFKDWSSIIRYICERSDKDQKLIIAIDEFQYLAQINQAVPSIFQGLIDEYLHEQNCMLILCGSIISLMYKTVLSYSSPLYGRRTSQIKLQALNFRDFQRFFPDKSSAEALEYYGILSGIPKYIELFEPEKTLVDSLKNNFLNTGKLFYQEPKFLLSEEVSSGKTYFSILQVIARGEHKLGKIASQIGAKNQNITSFLDKLRDLEIIEREVPVFEENPGKSKKGLYFFKDYFLKFWFTFIFPYSSYIEMGNKEWVISKIEHSFNEYTSLVFERVCREIIYEKVSFPVLKCGRHWDKDIEIDLVAAGENDILFGECKWSNSKVGLSVLRDLKGKVSQLDSGYIKQRKKHFALFSKSGFTKDLLPAAGKEKIDLIML